jgi:hypothetical protein
MKNTLLLAICLFILVGARAQQEETALLPFRKIVVSPKINLVLEAGEKESIRLVCNNVSAEKVNVVVKGKTLQLYLDHARFTEKQIRDYKHGCRQGIYADASVTAYVTYKQINTLEIRGEGEISCDSKIVSKKFKLRAYGECEINLASLKTKKFVTTLYGENKVNILAGSAERQVYRLIGENKIDTRGFSSETASASIIGEGKLSLNASDEVHVSALGEPVVMVSGNPVISKGIVIGRASINSQR